MLTYADVCRLDEFIIFSALTKRDLRAIETQQVCWLLLKYADVC
jgi:hypothetical protein